MARTKLQVDKYELIHQITMAEEKNTFDNRSKLAEFVASTDWGQSLNISPSVVTLRISEFNIEVKTQKGKRGNPDLKGGTRTRKPKVVKNIDILRKVFPASKEKLLDRLEKGSYKAATIACCLSCANFSASEVKNCTVKTCPLWGIR